MKSIICIAGPTASGKTALAVELAKAFNGEVISCDSMHAGEEGGAFLPWERVIREGLTKEVIEYHNEI